MLLIKSDDNMKRHYRLKHNHLKLMYVIYTKLTANG